MTRGQSGSLFLLCLALSSFPFHRLHSASRRSLSGRTTLGTRDTLRERKPTEGVVGPWPTPCARAVFAAGLTFSFSRLPAVSDSSPASFGAQIQYFEPTPIPLLRLSHR